MRDKAGKPSPAQRGARPLLLFLLLAALIALLSQRPGLRKDAAAGLRSAAYAGLGLSPHAVYCWRLRIAGLADSAIGRRWRAAIARAEPVRVSRAYRARGRFAADEIAADVYTLKLARGEQLQIRLRRDDAVQGRLFALLQRRTQDSGWQGVEPIETDGRVQHENVARGAYRIVVQPELGAAARYTLALDRGGSLPFPVAGGDQADIGGGFGAPRAAGKRKHKGVDIFADRGTPVYAVAAGRVATGTRGIGGNHVWLSTGVWGGRRFYYAHLDSFSVADGEYVHAGEKLGAVGNTGNARTTPPHLHFGVYVRGAAVDPAPFIEAPPEL